MMKRTFQESAEFAHSLNIANCLMFMAQGRDFDAVNITEASRVFECKTCNRQFPSFQALGGHRASHKKPRLTEGNGGIDTQPPMKPKTHECSVCGLEFSVGQALGGHMRRHRAGALHGNEKVSPAFTLSDDTAPLGKKANSKRVLCLDLNLTPNENDLELFRVGSKVESLVDLKLCA